MKDFGTSRISFFLSFSMQCGRFLNFNRKIKFYIQRTLNWKDTSTRPFKVFFFFTFDQWLLFHFIDSVDAPENSFTFAWWVPSSLQVKQEGHQPGPDGGHSVYADKPPLHDWWVHEAGDTYKLLVGIFWNPIFAEMSPPLHITGVLRLGVTHLAQSSGCPLCPTPVWILSFSFSSPPTLSCLAVLTGPARRTGRTSVRPPGIQSVSQDAFRSIFSVRFKTRKLDSTTTTTTTQLHDEAHELNNL